MPPKRTKAQKETIKLAKIRASPEVDQGMINDPIIELTSAEDDVKHYERLKTSVARDGAIISSGMKAIGETFSLTAEAIGQGIINIIRSTQDYNEALQRIAMVAGNAGVSVREFTEALQLAHELYNKPAEEAPKAEEAPEAEATPPLSDEAPAVEEIKKHKSDAGVRAKFVE